MNINTIRMALSHHSPAIMTGIGVAGVPVTAYSASVATLRAKKKIDEHVEIAAETKYMLTKTDKFKLIWTEYIPPAISATVSIACIIGAHSVSMRRYAALAGVYQLAERGYSEYRDHVKEIIGEKDEAKIHEKLVEERLKANPESGSKVYVTGAGTSLFFESLSGRYFECDMETVRRAENDTNYAIIHDGASSLNSFYARIGLEPTDAGEILGWDTDRMMEITFTTMISDTNRPCMVITYLKNPKEKYGAWR